MIMKKFKSLLPGLFCIVLLLIPVFITGKCLKLINSELKIRKALTQVIDYDEFRNLRISKKNLEKIKKNADKVLEKYPSFNKFPCMDYFGYLTFSMMISDYDIVSNSVPDINTFYRGIGRIAVTDTFNELYPYYKAIFSDIRYFPVPYMGKDAATVSFNDSWFAPRTYGGNRKHEGTDIMADNNLRGYFPVVSITDGIVEKIGWLEKGGNRIGIRAASGAYFYYAHLDSYAPGLKEGDTVVAGQFLGYMGDSGYGKEGTVGKFDVHLHVGIYVPSDSMEISVNPYWILKILEHSRTKLAH